MQVYIFVILSISLLALMYDYINIDLRNSSHKRVIKPVKVFLFLMITLILIFVSGFRFEVGDDYLQYVINYDGYVRNVWQSITEFNEPGMNIIAYISSLINGDYGGMFLIAAIITVGLSLYTIYKSTDRIFLSVLLYVFIGSWHGSFNVVRQFLAAAILFYGHKYILDKKAIKYFLTVFLAATFHLSVLPMILLYFVPQRKLKKREILFFLSVAIISLFSYDIILNYIGIILKEIRGRQFIINDYVLRQINITRVIIKVSPILLYMFASKKDNYDNKDYFYINILFVNMVIAIASSNSAYLNRFVLYTNIFTTLGIPSILKGFKNKEKYLLIFLIIILYFAFWYVEVSSVSNLYNYKFIFN